MSPSICAGCSTQVSTGMWEPSPAGPAQQTEGTKQRASVCLSLSLPVYRSQLRDLARGLGDHPGDGPDQQCTPRGAAGGCYEKREGKAR